MPLERGDDQLTVLRDERPHRGRRAVPQRDPLRVWERVQASFWRACLPDPVVGPAAAAGQRPEARWVSQTPSSLAGGAPPPLPQRDGPLRLRDRHGASRDLKCSGHVLTDSAQAPAWVSAGALAGGVASRVERDSRRRRSRRTRVTGGLRELRRVGLVDPERIWGTEPIEL